MFLKIFLPKALNFFIPVAVLSGGSYYAYDTYWPKTIGEWLEREGHRMADKNEYFEAMYVDNREDVPNLPISDLDVNNTVEMAKKMKSWCRSSWSSKWNESLKNKLLKFCVFTNAKTPRALFISTGNKRKLISNEEDYKTIFLIYKKNLSKILNVDSSTSVEEGKEKLKDWCKRHLDGESKGSLKQINNLCTKLNYYTVEEKIKNTRRNWKMKEEKGEWNKKFEIWKYTEQILKSINKYLSPPLTFETPTEEGGQHLKNWCKNGMSRSLLEEGVYPQEYSELISVCL